MATGASQLKSQGLKQTPAQAIIPSFPLAALGSSLYIGVQQTYVYDTPVMCAIYIDRLRLS
jgi:hypothetical protein